MTSCGNVLMRRRLSYFTLKQQLIHESIFAYIHWCTLLLSHQKRLPVTAPAANLRLSWENLGRRQELSPHLLQAVHGWHEVRARSRYVAVRFLADHSPYLIFSAHREARRTHAQVAWNRGCSAFCCLTVSTSRS